MTETQKSSLLGMSILNPNLNFSCKTSKIINDHLFIITKSNEILVYIKREDKINNVSYFEKRFILLSTTQSREDIIDIFIMSKAKEILNQNEKVILVLSKSLIINYYHLTDGLCISKINLQSFKDDDIIFSTEINHRFLLLIFKKKALLFDTFSQVVFKEESMKVLNKVIENQNETVNEKNNFQSFDVMRVYPVKENSFFLLSTDNDTYFLNITNLSIIPHLSLAYEDTRIRIIKQTFRLDKFLNEESILCIFSNQEFLFHNYNQKISVSFLDSVEELTELSTINSKAKFPIIYINKLNINKDEKLLVLYKDLACELYTYNKKIREIKLERKFIIMIEEFINMKYLVGDNVLIGYTDNRINIFDLRRNIKNNEKYYDKVIYLNDIFNKNKKDKAIFFTNYFKANFPTYINNVINEISLNSDGHKCELAITASSIYSYAENKSIYYIIGTSNGKVAIIDIFLTENLKLNPIFIIEYHQYPIETFSIYDNRILITSSNDGTITFTDISTQKIEGSINNFSLNKIDYIDNLNVNDLIRQNCGRWIRQSTDNYKQFNYSYIKKIKRDSLRSNDNKNNDNSNRVNSIKLIPCHNIKSFSKLSRILPVESLDTDLKYITEMRKRKWSLLAFEMENSELIVIQMNNFETIYHFNQATSNKTIEAVYHISSRKVLIFYLNDNSIRVSSYATRTCDRYITNLDKIYEILQVEVKLHRYFIKPEKVEDYVTNISNNTLKFDENELNDNNKKQLSGYSYSSSYGSKDDVNNMDKISVYNIKKNITNEKERELFIEKFFSVIMGSRQKLDSSQNKFEAPFMRAKGKYIIDEIIRIINSDYNDKLKKIKIMNLLFNHQRFMKLIEVNECELNGINGSYLYIGGQYNEFIKFNFEDYFIYIEKKIQEQKNLSEKFRTNYFNFLSLFHIWNFSLDIDTYIYLNLKLFQPIFETFPILIGIDSSCSVILSEEANIDDNINLNINFSEHFNYFNLHWKKPSYKEKGKKKSHPFLNKGLLLENSKGYLVNLKNYKIGQNLSHHLHLALFGCLVALLGLDPNRKLCEIIEQEKKLMRILATRREIEYSNFEMFHSFMFYDTEDITMTNKDILLHDYLHMEYSIATKEKYDISIKMRFKLSMDNIMLYLNKVYRYIFNVEGINDIYQDFHKLTKDANIDSGNKLAFLSEYELSMINFLVKFNSIAALSNNHDEIPDDMTIKITQLLMLFVIKIIREKNAMKIAFSKNIVDLLLESKIKKVLNKLYQENMINYAKLLLEFYISCNLPVDLESLIKKFDIGQVSIIKSEKNLNFLKIMLAKLIKEFSKSKLNLIIRIIMDNFKRKKSELKEYRHQIELLWLLFRDRSYNKIQYLPHVIELIMIIINSQNKELKHECVDNSKKVLSQIFLNFPMTNFHQGSQKIAVGSIEGKIYIYDMITGNRYKTLSAHSEEITALQFDVSGNIICSYSSKEHCVKLWKIGLTNFFSNIFSQKDGYYKQKIFQPVKEKISDEQIIENVKFQTIPHKDKEILLIRENKTVEMINL